MSISTVIENGLVMHRITETVRPEDLVRTVRNRHSIPDFRANMNILWHFQEISGIQGYLRSHRLAAAAPHSLRILYSVHS